MSDQEVAKHKKWYQKGWFITLVIVVIIIGVLAVVGNAQKKKNEEEAARLQQQIQLQQEKTDCYAKAGQLGDGEYYDEAVNGPAFAACDAKYGQ